MQGSNDFVRNPEQYLFTAAGAFKVNYFKFFDLCHGENMKLLISCAIAAVVGVWLFSSRSEILIGAVFGIALVYLLKQNLDLQKRVAQIEEKFGQNKAQASASYTRVQPDSPLPRQEEPDNDTSDFIIEPARSADVRTQVNDPTPVRVAARTVTSGTAPAPEKAKGLQVELWNIVVSYFTGGNVVVRAGVVVLFFGVAFLLKYSAERNLVPIEFSLCGVAAGALAMLVFGWRLRFSRTGYAMILQGGAIGVLYLTIFAALRLYSLLPPALALPLLIGMSLFSAALAILQDARVLAVIGVLGGFLAPILTSTGAGSHVMLFGYYALLNLGILLIARHRAWRELNLLGFLFTFGIGTLWGSKSYTPELFASTEPFLLLFFLFYLTIGVLFARNLPLPQKGYIDGTMVFGTPIVCFALQAQLVKPFEYGLAWSALGMGLIYAGLAWWVFKKGSEAMRTMIESFLAMGVIFATVAIPLSLDGRWTATAWALEGAAIIWIALKQQRWMPRIFGLVLQPLAGAAFLLDAGLPSGQLAVFNSFYLGALMISLAGFFSGLCLYRQHDKVASGRLESLLMLGWALLWWFGSGAYEIERLAPYRQELALLLSFVALSSLIAFLIGRRLEWPELTQVYMGLLLAMLGAIGFFFLDLHGHPLSYGGFIAWPLAFVIHYLLLKQDDEGPLARFHHLLHIGLLLLMITLCGWEAAWWTDHWVHGSGVWSLVVLALVPAVFMFLLCKLWDTWSWPLFGRQTTYLYHALLPVAAYLWLGSIATNLFSRGNPWPLKYLPLLNPLDLTQACVLLVLAGWLYVVYAKLEIAPLGLQRRALIIVGGATVFFWLNAMLIRTLHYWGDVPFHLRAMTNSDLVQTSLSIFWTLSAMLIMLFAARRSVRPVWMAGAGLIGVVMVKLFIFDLANTSTVERIISFMGVGVLCLAIGYLAPLPTRGGEERTADQ